jgi:ribosomal protein S18 acetylase RimI-like enzyme
MEYQTMQMTITRTRPDVPEVVTLIHELNEILEADYPPESRHGFSVEKLIAQNVAFFVVHVDGVAVGCGGIKLFDDFGELKRMYVRAPFRGQRIAEQLIDVLTQHAISHGITCLRLETGIHSHEAIRLYERVGFVKIPPFGDYREDPLSICYEKKLVH